jgi:hypothetical protein
VVAVAVAVDHQVVDIVAEAEVAEDHLAEVAEVEEDNYFSVFVKKI